MSETKDEKKKEKMKEKEREELSFPIIFKEHKMEKPSVVIKKRSWWIHSSTKMSEIVKWAKDTFKNKKVFFVPSAEISYIVRVEDYDEEEILIFKGMVPESFEIVSILNFYSRKDKKARNFIVLYDKPISESYPQKTKTTVDRIKDFFIEIHVDK